MSIEITFLDAQRTAAEKPDPKYPDGKDIDLRAPGQTPYCGYSLPYPAPRVGAYSVRCVGCNFRALITVAGRADDPRRVVFPCKGLDQ